MNQGYNVYEIAPRTWTIQDCTGGNAVNTFLLEGDEQAMLIDSGYGQIDLAGICASLTNKPVFCVLTHGHIDHAMGVRQFSRRYMHSLDLEQYVSTEKNLGLEHVDVEFLDDIPFFELGNRKVEWNLFTGHTAGSIVLFDHQTGWVFDGDAENAFLWLFLPGSSDISEYKKNLEANIKWMAGVGAKGRFCGHTSPKSPMDIDLSNLVACAEKIICGAKEDRVLKFNLGVEYMTKVYGYNGWEICYR